MTDVAAGQPAVFVDSPLGPRTTFARRPNALTLARQAGVPVLDVVVPVHNEQAALELSSIPMRSKKLHASAYLATRGSVRRSPEPAISTGGRRNGVGELIGSDSVK